MNAYAAFLNPFKQIDADRPHARSAWVNTGAPRRKRPAPMLLLHGDGKIEGTPAVGASRPKCDAAGALEMLHAQQSGLLSFNSITIMAGTTGSSAAGTWNIAVMSVAADIRLAHFSGYSGIAGQRIARVPVRVQT